MSVPNGVELRFKTVGNYMGDEITPAINDEIALRGSLMDNEET